ncbi:MAG: bifunctional phosphoribosylaminoimidazolecarboxamide formyltransferase/IMP cyclohydrolase [Dehalococcoidales bacterium]|nr:bifunctional phosphoribosylaminoimidazolecarboxamide formyltransferase/IMP cyclohydrolase [Dehalococcoidales bacterium]
MVDLGTEIYSTGGTAAELSRAGVPVKNVSDLTGFPEILEGRVKTLHPLVYGGILARRDVPEHMEQLTQHGIRTVDLVAVNLYPFVETIKRPGVSLEEALENIDIGGPSLIRAAAKNYKDVLVVVDPADYESILAAMRKGGLDVVARQRLAAKAYQHTATYDTHIASYLRVPGERFPQHMAVALEKVQDLRYGENPHQRGAFYAEDTATGPYAGLAGARQLQGKALSYCNVLDLDAAWACVRDFAATAVAVIKHSNPCGLASGDDLLETYRRAHAGDPVSAFGGVIGLNREVDAATANEIVQTFYEDIIAPGYTPEALGILKSKKNLRVMEIDPEAPGHSLHPGGVEGLDFKRVNGGFVVQDFDAHPLDEEGLRVVTKREPTLDELTDLLFAWRVVKYVKSNAIVLARGLATVGIGAGQMSRVDSVDIAVRKAGDRAAGSVMASDAYFPKPDGLELAARAGVTAVVQPGGSIRDDEAIRMADRHHMAMIVTGFRHFRH